MMVIDNAFNIGDTVYLRTDEEQLPRLVTCLSVRQHQIAYELACGSQSSYHYDFEISRERDVLKASGVNKDA